jgi:hypothetical protein
MLPLRGCSARLCSAHLHLFHLVADVSHAVAMCCLQILTEFLVGTATPIMYFWLEPFCTPVHPQQQSRGSKVLPRAGLKADEYADFLLQAQV